MSETQDEVRDFIEETQQADTENRKQSEKTRHAPDENNLPGPENRTAYATYLFRRSLPPGVRQRIERINAIRTLYVSDPETYSWRNLWKSDLLIGYRDSDREKLLRDALGDPPEKLSVKEKQLLRMERAISREE